MKAAMKSLNVYYLLRSIVYTYYRFSQIGMIFSTGWLQTVVHGYAKYGGKSGGQKSVTSLAPPIRVICTYLHAA